MAHGFEIHLHITRKEMIDFIDQGIGKRDVHVFAQKFFPFKADLVRPEDLMTFLGSNDSPYEVLMLTVENPEYSVTSQFPPEYPDSFFIPLPRLVDDKIRQIQFGFRVRKGDEYNQEALSIWRSIFLEIKRNSYLGIQTHFVKSGNTRRSGSDRFTKGAAEAFCDGVILEFQDDAIGLIDVERLPKEWSLGKIK